jgi:hypothetical protein
MSELKSKPQKPMLAPNISSLGDEKEERSEDEPFFTP